MRSRGLDKILNGQGWFVAALALFAIICVFGGGASRIDALSQPFVWIAAILLGLVCVLRSGTVVETETQRPMLFFAGVAGVMLLQLVPLPPAVWTLLPGRSLYEQAATVGGIDQPWRPVSLTPDLTWASLLGLLPVFAIILAFSRMPDAWRRHLVTFLAALVLLSGILGLAQVTGGSGGPLRLYAITNKDAAVGLFANRNHQALLLVMGLPIMAIWSRMVQFDKRYEAAPKWIALGVAIFLIPLILVTGSRGGLLLLGVAVPAALLLLRGKRTVGHEERIYSRFDGLFKWLPLVAIVIVLTLAVILARTTALDRLTATTLAEEQRNQIFPYLVEAATSFFPFGSGFGSFDSVYRAFEPVVLLNQSYMNQAHNDVLQLIIEGGLPGVILLLAGLWWYGKRAIAHWRGTGVVSTTQLLGRLGSVLVALILLSSFVDYPLRTPIMAVILAIAMLWMAQNPNRRQAT